MIYTICKNDELIAYSDDLNLVYKYLSDFYNRENKSQIVLSTFTNDNKPEFIENDCDEHRLVEFYDEIIIPTWEYAVWYNYFNDLMVKTKDNLVGLARERLSEHGKEPNDMNIEEFLKKTLGNKYYSMILYDRFLEDIGYNVIRMTINSGVAIYLYELNKEFERKINIDN